MLNEPRTKEIEEVQHGAAGLTEHGDLGILLLVGTMLGEGHDYLLLSQLFWAIEVVPKN